MFVCRACPILICLTFSIGTLGADTLILVNGDRISGTVKGLEDRKLVIKSPMFDENLRVDWSKVRDIQSGSTFSVLTEEGLALDGQLSMTEDTTTISSHDGSAATVPSSAIVRIVPSVAKSPLGQFLTRLVGAADVGYSLVRGNQNQMQSSLGARAEYTTAKFQVSSRLDSLFAQQEGARPQSRHALNARLDRFVNAKLFTYGLTAFERNERRRLDLRSRLGGGVGWRMRNTRRTELSVLGGLAYSHERYRNVPNRKTSEGSLGIEWETRLTGDLEIRTQFTVLPDVFNYRSARVEFDFELRVPITQRITYSLRLFDRFHTRPPATVDRNDSGLVSGVGLTF